MTHHGGFNKYEPVNQALQQLLSAYQKHSCFHPQTEAVNLLDAPNRVLSEDFIVPIDIPPFTRSAMDGYAVIASDTKGASNKHHITLEVVGKTFAGDTNTLKVSPGKAVAVATGGRIPQGADAVVMVEYTALDGGKVKVFKEIELGKNVALKGEDLQKGAIILKKGTWLRPQDVGLIASVGIPTVKVICKPKVAVFSTGSELVEPGSKLNTDAVLYDSNRYMLSAMINEAGGEAVNLGICKDDENTIMATLKKALQYDLVVMSGGSSVGEKDYVPAVINRAGKPGVLVHGVAMRPGSPTALSIVEGKPVISTPGYPVACYFAFYTFGKPLLLRMLGTTGLPEGKVTAKMASGIKLHEEMQTFLRVKLKTTKDRKGELYYLAEPVSAAAASIQRTLTGSDGVVMVNKSRLVKGQKVEVHLLRAQANNENSL
ncbi:MAG TPA: gephyrin-like molybdotransferase Glp [Candidatus Acidoferrales bacterium]|nr:gephyrin-like molybdotransferase Glp [Candidatus Acidoferrales bacterium]